MSAKKTRPTKPELNGLLSDYNVKRRYRPTIWGKVLPLKVGDSIRLRPELTGLSHKVLIISMTNEGLDAVTKGLRETHAALAATTA